MIGGAGEANDGDGAGSTGRCAAACAIHDLPFPAFGDSAFILIRPFQKGQQAILQQRHIDQLPGLPPQLIQRLFHFFVIDISVAQQAVFGKFKKNGPGIATTSIISL